MMEFCMVCDPAMRIYTLPNGVEIYMNREFGNQDIIYCGKDGECVPFPEEMGIYHYDAREIKLLGGKTHYSGLYTWEPYALTWKGLKFMEIATVSKHVAYELAKIKE